MSTSTPDPAPAEAALAAFGVPYRLTRHERVGSLAEAAALRGIQPADLIKTMVVRRGEEKPRLLGEGHVVPLGEDGVQDLLQGGERQRARSHGELGGLVVLRQ